MGPRSLFLFAVGVDGFLRLKRQQPLYTQCKLPTEKQLPKNTELPKDDTRDTVFDAGVKIDLACQKGFVVLDKDGGEPFLECTDAGYFSANGGQCVAKPKCVDPMEMVVNAKFAGEEDPEKGARYQCNEGYSTDGADGGTYGQGNVYFWLRCDIVKEMYDYTDVGEKCKPVQMALTKTFTTIFDVLFGVNCENGVLNPGETGLSGVNSGPAFAKFVCDRAEDAGEKAACQGKAGDLEKALKANWDDRENAAKTFCDWVWSDVIQNEIPRKHHSDYEGR